MLWKLTHSCNAWRAHRTKTAGASAPRVGYIRQGIRAAGMGTAPFDTHPRGRQATFWVKCSILSGQISPYFQLKLGKPSGLHSFLVEGLMLEAGITE